MKLGDKEVEEIIVTIDGEVVAVIADSEIVEKDGVSVIVNWKLA